MNAMTYRTLPLVAALLALGCHEAAPIGAPSPDSRSAALGAAGQAGSTSIDLPKTIAQHPAFGRLSERQLQRFGTAVGVAAELSAAELEHATRRLENCRQLGAGACGSELAALGLDIGPTAEDRQLAARLEADLGLAQRGFSPLVHVFQAATEHMDRARVVPATLGGGTVVCDAACRDYLGGKLSLPHGMALAAMFSQSSAGGALGDAVEGALIEIALDAIKSFLECWFDPDCNVPGEQDPDTIECRRDSDCDEDEYCADGLADLGPNECRPARSNGSNCSDDDQCLSDCCNFNLFGSECDTPNRCN